MAKTAQKEKKERKRPCPICGTALVATLVARSVGDLPKGMYWICEKCEFRKRVRE